MGAFVLHQSNAVANEGANFCHVQAAEAGVHPQVPVLRPRKQGLRRPQGRAQTLQGLHASVRALHPNPAVLRREHVPQRHVQGPKEYVSEVSADTGTRKKGKETRDE